MKALSIRQPWAWAIIAGHKTFENRTWQTKYRGSLLIHAGQSMHKADYELMLLYGCERGFDVPCMSDLHRGGIIGRVDLVDMVTAGEGDLWFRGPIGWRLTNPHQLPFQACKGRLGLFEIAA